MKNPIPVEIKQLFINPTKIDIIELKQRFKIFDIFMNEKYNFWFPKKTQYCDEQMAGEIFKKEVMRKDKRAWVRYQMYAIIKTFKRIFVRIEYNFSKPMQLKNVNDDLRLINELLFEVICFIDYSNEIIEGRPAGFGYAKTNILNSTAIFEASKMILKESIDLNSRGLSAIRPLSIFLLRQSLEIKLINAF